MNQAEVTKLMSQLKIAVSPRYRKLKNPDGPEGRMLKLRKSVTALFKYERLEMMYNRADETRGYAERVSQRIDGIPLVD
jgi:large subunit ribosomal protein L17